MLASVAARPATLPSVSTVSVDIDLNPLRSNIYGTAERVLLEWLNRLYQEQKNQLFSHLPEGWRCACWSCICCSCKSIDLSR